MSHVALVEITITDLDALQKACAACGLEFRKDQKTYRWFGKWVSDYHAKDAAYLHGINPKDYGKCIHAIGVPDNKQAYEIGVCSNPKGAGYVLIWDFWNGGYGLLAIAGENCDKLFQAYTKEVTVKKLKNKGYSLTKTNVYDNGEIELELINYS